MIEKHGDLFDTTAHYIGHGVNIVGVMGAGIAKTFKDRYPVNYLAYRNKCRTKELKPGGILPIYENQRVVLNIASQDLPGAHVNYDWTAKGLLAAAEWVRDDTGLWYDRDKRIAIPEIGCGIGGLEWSKVKHILELIESRVPEVEFEVWHHAG